MSRKALELQLADARTQLIEAQRELELSTFLNKGVLQSNSEFKLRIAELEQENSVLRVAESRLARTEDKAELAERRAKEVFEEMRDKEAEWESAVRAEVEVREGLEVELESLREEVRGWREVGERIGGLMARSSTRGERSVRRTNAVAGPSRSQATRATPLTPSSSKALSRFEASAQRRPPSPTVLIQSTRISKRRRRIEDSGSATEEDNADTYAPSSPAADRTPLRPTRPAAVRNTRANSASTKKRDSQPAVKRADTGRTRRSSPAPPVNEVKVEERSPDRESEESEDDPLYME